MTKIAHFIADVKRRSIAWVCDRPILGWYFAVLLFINYALDLVSAFL